MKLLVVHLSDAHFVDRTYISDKIVEAQVRAINSLGEHDKYALVFSGDLSYSGKHSGTLKSIFLSPQSTGQNTLAVVRPFSFAAAIVPQAIRSS